ncbi:MAG: MFS transporter [Actinomycetes bacterium]
MTSASVAPAHPLLKRTLQTLAGAQSLSGLGYSSTVAAGSLLVASITKSEALAGLAQTFGVLGAAAMALPLANLTRRGGRRLALSSGYAIGALGAVLAVIGGATELLPILFLGTFLVGAAAASGYQARYAAVDLATQDNRARSLSLVVWASTIGSVLGPNLIGPVGDFATSIGFPRLTGPYMFSAIMLGLGSAVIWFRLKPDPYLTSTASHSEESSSKTKIPTKEVLAHIASRPHALLGLLALSMGHLIMVAVMVMTPVHMAHVDVSLNIIGLVISVHIAGMYALSPVVGYLTDRLGRQQVIAIGGLILVGSAIISGTAPDNNEIQLGIGLFLLGLGWSCTLIAGSTLLSESVSDHYRAPAQGTSDLIMNLSAAVGGALAGVIIALLSYGWLCALAAIPITYVTILAIGQLVKSPRT